jgi:hypothetical protein
MPLPVLLVTLPGHIALSLYLLLRSSFTPRFKPMLRGLIAGVMGAYEVRESGLWREPARKAPLVQLLGRMSWHPGALSSRKVQVRAAKD